MIKLRYMNCFVTYRPVPIFDVEFDPNVLKTKKKFGNTYIYYVLGRLSKKEDYTNIVVSFLF